MPDCNICSARAIAQDARPGWPVMTAAGAPEQFTSYAFDGTAQTYRTRDCSQCPAFQITRDIAQKGKSAMTTRRPSARRMARDEQESEPTKRGVSPRMLGLLAKMAPDDMAWALKGLDALLNGTPDAEDDGEGFSSPHERELERMNDKRNQSPAMDSRRMAFDHVRTDPYRGMGTTTVAAGGLKVDADFRKRLGLS